MIDSPDSLLAANAGQGRAMSEIYAPMMRALVVAALMLATATLMLVALNTARAAGTPHAVISTTV